MIREYQFSAHAALNCCVATCRHWLLPLWVPEPPPAQASRRGLRRRVRSERHHSSEQRERLGLGVVVLMLTPRALDGNDHLLDRIDVDVLAEGADRQKGAAVGCRPAWAAAAVSRGAAPHQPTEGGGRAVGLAGEIAPAGRQDPSANKRLAVLRHQLAEAADIAQTRAGAKSAPLQTALGLEYPVRVGLHAVRSPDRLGTVVGQRPARGGRYRRAKQATVAGRICAHYLLTARWPLCVKRRDARGTSLGRKAARPHVGQAGGDRDRQ